MGAAALWSAGTMLLLGGLIGAISALPVALSSRRGAAPRWACVIQAMLIVSLAAWLYLNHQLTLKTDEAMTLGTFSFLFSNPTEVMDMVWRFEGYHFVGFILVCIACCALLARVLRPLNDRLLACRAGDRDEAPPAGAIVSVLARCRPTRPLGATMLTLFALPAILLGVQLTAQPSRSLVTTAQAFPPLRAIHMMRWLTTPALEVAAPDPQGKPLIGRDAFLGTLKADPARLRNVILVLLESVPAKALHCHGYPREVSPNIDRLAAEGISFNRCYAAASFSSYSQISTFTSLYMLRAETNDHFRDTSFPHVCLREVLRSLGYETAAFSSGNESWDNLEAFYPPNTWDLYFTHNHCDVQKTDCNRMDDKFAMGRFAQWLGSRRADRPFYAYVNLQATHFNYEVPEPWASRYKPIPPLYSNGDGVIHIPPDVLPLLKNQYDNALGYVDHWIGFMRRQLELTGQLDRTIFVIVGDHGEAFMEHGLARHGMHLWDEMIHVPLIVFAPGLVEPKRIEQAASQIDIAPTVMGLMGLPPHPAWQGVNVLAGDYDETRRPVFSVLQLTRFQETVIWGRLKYMADQNTREEWLFDLSSDPNEKTNLCQASPPPPSLDRLRRALAGWHAYQLAYYADKNRQRTHYVGMPQPPPANSLHR